MATRRWIGKAADKRHVVTVTIANTWATGDTVTVTIDSVDFTVTIGTLVTTAQVATSLKEAFAAGGTLADATASYSPNLSNGAQGVGFFAEIEATVSGSVVTFTARTAGVPFTMTASEVTAGTGTATLATSVTATGKNFFSDQDNWSGNTVPVDGDDIVFDAGNVDCLYGLTPAIQPGSFTHTMGYTGKIGLPDMNPGPTGSSDNLQYYEYRTRHLTFDDNTTTCTYNIGEGTGSGSGRIRIDAGAGRATVVVTKTGQRSTAGAPAFEFIGTHASNDITNFDGDLGIATLEGQSTTAATLRSGSGPNSSAATFAGNDSTLTTVIVSGGTLTINASSTTHTQHAGTTNQLAGAPATLSVHGGTYNDRSTATIATAVTIGSSGSYDRSGDVRAKTITPLVNLYKGSKFLDPNASLTLTNGFKLNGCTVAEVTIDFGRSRTHTLA